MKNFRITDNKGFQLTFDNGWTVSVQFGAGNYGDHYDTPFSAKGSYPGDSDEAEVGVFRDGPDGKNVWWDGEQADALGFFSGVLGYQASSKVASIIQIVASL